MCFLYKVECLHLNRQLLTTILVFVFGCLHASIPWIRSLSLLCVFGFLSGVGAGNYNAVATTWLMEMWSGRKVLGPLMQALSLMYGVGAILGPLVARPFVMGGSPRSRNQTDAGEEDFRRHRLAHPFAIAGMVEAFFGFLLLALLILKPYKKDDKLSLLTDNKDGQEDDQPGKKKLFDSSKEGPNDRPWARWVFVAMMTLSFGTFNLCDIGYLTFMNTYMQKLDTITIDATRASEIDSITATAYTVGRLVNVLVTRRLPITYVLVGHYLLSFVGIVAMFWTSHNEVLLILNSIVLGYAFSATIPAMFTYVDSMVSVNEGNSSFFFVALSAPSVFTPIIVGGYVDTYPLVLVWLLLASASATIILFCALQILVLWQIRVR